MKKNYTAYLITFLMVLLLGSTGSQAQTTITMWDFDAEELTPTSGSGTAENIGGTSSEWVGGNPSTGNGWNTSAYPAQSTGSGTAGVQFTVSTAGYTGIAVSWDNRNSNTSANRLRLQYTIDGSNWLNFEATPDNAANIQLDGTAVGFDNGRYISVPGAVWFNRVAEFQNVAGVNNNPNFAVRMVTEFATADSYVASTEGSSYSTIGTIRCDNVTFMGTVAGLEPALTDVLLPSYMQGTVPNQTKVTYAWLTTISNLLPNTTYRYYNRVVLASDSPTYTGAGNIIYANQDGTFTRITSPSLSTSGAYGEFTTDEEGSFKGWFITEPTDNASRFEPGTLLHMRVMLNDGANGGTEATFLTTEETVKVLGFGTAAADTAGTAIRGVSDFAEKNFVVLYSNAAGEGRPLFATMVEATGIDIAAAGNYAPFYLTHVADQSGAWGGIVPNTNPGGVRRVEERSLTGGILAQHSNLNGLWGGVDTRNPSGGVDGVLVINTIVGINEIPATNCKVYTYGNQLSIEFQKDTQAEISVISIQGSLIAAFTMNTNKQLFNLDIPVGIYLVKITTPSGTFNQKILVK